MNNTPVIIGVDLGATFVRVGLFTREGESLDFKTIQLDAERKVDTGVRCTIELIEKILKDNDSPHLLGIGTGSTGPVNPIDGTIISPYTDPAWQFVPYTQPLKDHFGVPCVLENDADAAALGEFWKGAGQNVSRLLAVTVGTGIGTALIVDGRIYRGMNGLHPEGGHHIIDPSGPECYCGVHGCWESLASGEALTAYSRQQAQNNPAWLRELGLDDVQFVDGVSVSQAARQGNQLAMQIMQREAHYLSIGLINMMAVYVPERIVLSGGVMKSFDLLEATIQNTLKRDNPMIPASQVQIMPAKLGYFAGAIGAAYALKQATQI